MGTQGAKTNFGKVNKLLFGFCIFLHFRPPDGQTRPIFFLVKNRTYARPRAVSRVLARMLFPLAIPPGESPGRPFFFRSAPRVLPCKWDAYIVIRRN